VLKLTTNQRDAVVLFVGDVRVRILTDDRARVVFDAPPRVHIRREIMLDRLVPNWRDMDNDAVLAAMEMRR
jgi:hypothetical protein